MFRTALISMFLTSTALADTWTVDDDGKADFPTIQYAIDAAINGDEIIVAPGTYTSTADDVVDMRGKQLWLHSSGGAEVTIIDGEGARRGIYCHNDETSKTIIEGFTITGGDAAFGHGGGMYNFDSDPTIIDCIFNSNYADEGGGMAQHRSNSTIINCTFVNNTANYGGGLYNTQYSHSTLINCIFTDNSASNGGGMHNDYLSNNPTLTNCLFKNNIAANSGGGLYNRVGDGISNNPTLLGCTFEGNSAVDYGGGMWCHATTITGCSFIQNIATNGGGIYSGGSNSKNSPTIGNANFCENNPDAIYGNWNNNGGNEFLSTCGNDDDDGDGILDDIDNCYLYNPDQTDCNGNDVGDVCDIADGTSTDWDGNEIPDDCECLADVNTDGNVNVNDILILIGNWGSSSNIGDINFDGIVDVSDLLYVIGNWGACE